MLKKIALVAIGVLAGSYMMHTHLYKKAVKIAIDSKKEDNSVSKDETESKND